MISVAKTNKTSSMYAFLKILYRIPWVEASSNIPKSEIAMFEMKMYLNVPMHFSFDRNTNDGIFSLIFHSAK